MHAQLYTRTELLLVRTSDSDTIQCGARFQSTSAPRRSSTSAPATASRTRSMSSTSKPTCDSGAFQLPSGASALAYSTHATTYKDEPYRYQCNIRSLVRAANTSYDITLLFLLRRSRLNQGSILDKNHNGKERAGPTTWASNECLYLFEQVTVTGDCSTWFIPRIRHVLDANGSMLSCH